jgi:DNA/RNA-binding domain of Phe-tRNA-synthetase-like protein
MILQKSETWKKNLPEGLIGLLLISSAPNLPGHPALESALRDLEDKLRERFGSQDRTSLREDPVLGSYDAFYHPFRKTYHVQLQLESVVFKGKNIYSPSALVACMFMAELKTGLLTAAHDFSAVQPPLVADIATGQEIYQRLDNTQQQLKGGDMYIRDQKGILSSVIYGPDRRTQILPETEQALYTTYGPPGISAQQIYTQLEILECYVKMFAPQATRSELIVI